jgi:hypothetical protein
VACVPIEWHAVYLSATKILIAKVVSQVDETGASRARDFPQHTVYSSPKKSSSLGRDSAIAIRTECRQTNQPAFMAQSDIEAYCRCWANDDDFLPNCLKALDRPLEARYDI